MNEIYVTLTGNTVAEPRQHQFRDGSRVTSLRVATTSRYFDRKSQEWRDGERTFFAVRCFRGLADNVAQSVRAGQPVVVHGRLRFREFEHKGERRFMPEVEASSVGHDLRWGLGTFTKPQRGAAPAYDPRSRDQLDESTHDWALPGGRAQREDQPAGSGLSLYPGPGARSGSDEATAGGYDAGGDSALADARDGTDPRDQAGRRVEPDHGAEMSDAAGQGHSAEMSDAAEPDHGAEMSEGAGASDLGWSLDDRIAA